MKKYVIFDIETDGLVSTKIHVVSTNDGDNIKSTSDYNEMRA